MTHRISEHAFDDDEIQVSWSDGRRSVYHHLWLRDNCSSDLHPQTMERTGDVQRVDPAIRPTSVAVDGDGGLLVRWPDRHVSRYAPDWLRRYCYTELSRNERRAAPNLWSAAIANDLPQADHNDIMESDAGLLDFLELLRGNGFCLVRNMPEDDQACQRVAGRIAYLRETNFGVDFTVASKPEPNNNAYTAIELPVHTDLANREMPPGIQFLHCVEFEASGGQSVLVDGFRVAALLREESRHSFDLLTRVPIPFRFHDTEWDVRWRAPMLALDGDGVLAEIRYNNALMAPLEVAPELVKPVYAAIRAFARILKDPLGELRLTMAPGDMLAFHNRRILHGRSAFDPNTGPRKLRGCYVDVDEMMSRIRVLKGENLLR